MIERDTGVRPSWIRSSAPANVRWAPSQNQDLRIQPRIADFDQTRSPRPAVPLDGGFRGDGSPPGTRSRLGACRARMHGTGVQGLAPCSFPISPTACRRSCPCHDFECLYALFAMVKPLDPHERLRGRPGPRPQGHDGWPFPSQGRQHGKPRGRACLPM